MKEKNLVIDNNKISLELINQLEQLNARLIASILYDRVPVTLLKRAVEKSADYVEENMPGVILFTASNKQDMWNCAISKLKIDGHLAEFGVFKGESINYLAKLIYPKKIFGFDSFKGLEEDYCLDNPKGNFNLNGNPPIVEKNVSLVKGSFSSTLPEWLEENKGAFSFIHIDCDTYESTSTVLNSIGKDGIVSGTVILFDEYFGFYGWEHAEFKAWKDYCNNNDIKYRYIAVCQMQVLIEVL